MQSLGMMHPNSDEIEITVFGPGYGECIVIHIGSNKWIIIDSCLDDDGEPAALSYLKSLDVQVHKDVVSVMVTHWHDDHIKGLSRIVKTCSQARFSLASALTYAEFLAFLIVHENQPVYKLDRGGTELLACLKHLRDTNRSIKPLNEDTIVVDFEPDILTHRKRLELRALSPSGQQFTDFISSINDFTKEMHGKAKTRLTAQNRNELSVVTLLTIGEEAALLGADQEEVGSSNKGWRAIVEARRGKGPRASLFKVPHHGSAGAHNSEVWSELLKACPKSIVTPWKLGAGQLPKDSDRERIRKLSSNAYITSTRYLPVKRRYSRDVVKSIRTSGVKFDTVVYKGGHVTCRWTPSKSEQHITLHNGAAEL